MYALLLFQFNLLIFATFFAPERMPQSNQIHQQPFFRQEVTATRSQQWQGAIRLAQPIAGWLIAVTAVAIAGLLVAFVSIGSITKKARITGITLPVGGSISVSAPSAGLLAKILVNEGDIVKAGQALFEISSERKDGQGEFTALIGQQLAARAQTLESEQKLLAVQIIDKRQVLSQRLDNLAIELTELEQEIILSKRRLSLAQDSAARFQTLQSNGYVSGAQIQQKQEDLIDIAARLSGLHRNRLQLQSNQIALKAERAALANSLATEQSQLLRAKASLQQEIVENRSRKTNLVTANQTGVITTLATQTGQMIAFGQVLATLIPHSNANALVSVTPCQDHIFRETVGGQVTIATGVMGDCDGSVAKSSSTNVGDIGDATQLEAHLYAPSRTAGFVAKGQQVLIRYQAYPYQKFGLQVGTVTDVSQTPFAPTELPPSLASTILSNAIQNSQGFNGSEALYRIKVKLEKQTISAYGHANNLKPGMTLEADVLQDRRKIWEWVVEPVLAVARR